MIRILFALVVLTLPVFATNYSVQPKGEFAEIETKADQKLIKRLGKKRKGAIEDVLAKPNSYSPPVLYALSDALLRRGREEEAMFHFYLAQLRARSDANKALDTSARQAVAILNQAYGPPINQLAFTDIVNLKKIVHRVVGWDEQSVRTYDPRWIALHGMDAFSETTIRFEPEDRWNEIDQETRDQYLSSFEEAMGHLDEGS